MENWWKCDCATILKNCCIEIFPWREHGVSVYLFIDKNRSFSHIAFYIFFIHIFRRFFCSINIFHREEIKKEFHLWFGFVLLMALWQCYSMYVNISSVFVICVLEAPTPRIEQSATLIFEYERWIREEKKKIVGPKIEKYRLNAVKSKQRPLSLAQISALNLNDLPSHTWIEPYLHSYSSFFHII